MMRELRIWVVFMLVGMCSTGWAWAEKPKMATVDMQKLFKEYHRTVTAQKHFNAEYASIQKNLNEKSEAVNRKRAQLQKIAEEIKGNDLSDEQKLQRRYEGQLVAQEIKILQRRLSAMTQAEKGKVARKKAASMQGIMTDIKAKVVELSDKLGYDYVFDRSGLNTNQVSFFLYLKDVPDVTANVLKELNKFAPGADSE
ncbi:OmpH family outer membrane protein [Verrucomicrobiaceae bacterium R5-34]|nr:OmpH family outer membrane protein [Verrucomicrobiaceae bacterium R5-34]